MAITGLQHSRFIGRIVPSYCFSGRETAAAVNAMDVKGSRHHSSGGVSSNRPDGPGQRAVSTGRFVSRPAFRSSPAHTLARRRHILTCRPSEAKAAYPRRDQRRKYNTADVRRRFLMVRCGKCSVFSAYSFMADDGNFSLRPAVLELPEGLVRIEIRQYLPQVPFVLFGHTQCIGAFPDFPQGRFAIPRNVILQMGDVSAVYVGRFRVGKGILSA